MRLWLRLIVALTLLTFAVILVARLQPYDDGGLHEMLFSNDCQPPCFMGIRPGITTKDKAIQILLTNPWVASVTLLPDKRTLAWEWNGKQPALLRNDRIGNRFSFDQNNILYEIDVMTAANVGNFTLLLGAPDGWSMGNFGVRSSPLRLDQVAIYPTVPMILSGAADCPVSLYDQWTLPVQISLYATYDKSGGIWGSTLAELRPIAENAC